MKIHIVDNQEKAISGFATVLFKNLDSDFDQISNNSCELILANDIFDYVESKEILETIQKLLLKLRLGGKMVVGGKDLYLFCKSVKNHLISDEQASELISKSKSLINHSVVQEMITKLGLKYTTQLNGIHYEITAFRG
jgi:hypothetical protein